MRKDRHSLTRSLWRWGAVLLMIAPTIGSPLASAGVLAESLKRCLEHSAETSDDIETLCPEIQDRISHSALGPFLPDDWQNELTHQHLSDLLRLSETTDAAGGGNYGLDTAALESILQDLETDRKQEPLSLWDRFVKWLRGVLDQEDQALRPTWLDQFLQKLKLPTRYADILFYGSVVLILVIALAVVLNEVRASSWIKTLGFRRTKRADTHSPAGKDLPVGSSLLDLEAIPYRQRPVELLRRVIERLRQQAYLPADASLTNRELEQHLSRTFESHVPSFRRIRMLAEGISFGDWDPPRATVEQLINDSRAFLSALATRVPGSRRA